MAIEITGIELFNNENLYLSKVILIAWSSKSIWENRIQLKFIWITRSENILFDSKQSLAKKKINVLMF